MSVSALTPLTILGTPSSFRMPFYHPPSLPPIQPLGDPSLAARWPVITSNCHLSKQHYPASKPSPQCRWLLQGTGCHHQAGGLCQTKVPHQHALEALLNTKGWLLPIPIRAFPSHNLSCGSFHALKTYRQSIPPSESEYWGQYHCIYFNVNLRRTVDW